LQHRCFSRSRVARAVLAQAQIPEAESIAGASKLGGRRQRRFTFPAQKHRQNLRQIQTLPPRPRGSIFRRHLLYSK